MTLATKKHLLWLTAAACFAGAAAALALAWSPLDRAAVAPVVRPTSRPAAAASALPPLDDFSDAWGVPLRRPLIDSTPGRPLVAQRPIVPPPSPVRLVGVVEGNRGRRGLFVSGGGGVLLRAAGEAIGGVSVVRVDAAGASLNVNGVTIDVPLESFPATQPTASAASVSPPATIAPQPQSAAATTQPAVKLFLPPHVLKGIDLKQEP